MLKGFVSYAHADLRLCNQFCKHLKLLEGPGIAAFWADHGIAPGDPWKKVILEQLEQAQVALFLISPEMFWSRFIREEEWPLARRRMKAGDLLVIPVVLKTTPLWERQFDGELGELQAVPRWGKPIAESRSRNAACAEAVEMIAHRLKNRGSSPGGGRLA
jgi:TIR domain-containing protein